MTSPSRSKWLLSGVFLVLVSGAWHVQASEFGRINGRIVSCDEAAKYRDTTLLVEYDLVNAMYEDGTEFRKKLVVAELERYLADLESNWATLNSVGKKKIATNAVALMLAAIGNATAKWAELRPDLSEVQKQAIYILSDRSATLTSSILRAGLTNEVSLRDIALLPVSTVAAACYPPADAVLFAIGAGIGLIELGSSVGDWYLANQDYQKEAKTLRETIKKLSEKTVEQQLKRIEEAKNEIDKACNSPNNVAPQPLQHVLPSSSCPPSSDPRISLSPPTNVRVIGQ